MITIEEVIISSLYHRLVLVRIKKTPDVTNDEGADVDGGDEKVVQKAKGLGEHIKQNYTELKIF